MTTKPILFSTSMVQAILNASKTQTRRKIKYNKKIANPEIGFSLFTDKDMFSVRGIHQNGEYGESFFKIPICKDDVLWVRETFADVSFGEAICPQNICYKADYSQKEIELPENKGIWKPSIFMPKAACRIFLKVTEVCVERLNYISEEDAVAEGIETFYNKKFKETRYKDPVASFCSLWKSINGKESWEQNPLVWIYKFERIEKPKNFNL